MLYMTQFSTQTGNLTYHNFQLNQENVRVTSACLKEQQMKQKAALTDNWWRWKLTNFSQLTTDWLNCMQIMTGIEVNSEANFPKLREYCPSDRWWQSLFVLLYLWSKWRRHEFNYSCYFTLVYLHNSNNNKSSSADKVTWRCEAARINQIYLLQMLFSDKKCEWTFLKLATYLIYTNHLTFWPNTYAYCKKAWFWFLNGVVLPGV